MTKIKKEVKQNSLTIADTPDTQEIQKQKKAEEIQKRELERQRGLNFNQGHKLKVLSVKLPVRAISQLSQLQKSLNKKSKLRVTLSSILDTLISHGAKDEEMMLKILGIKTSRDKD